MNNEPDMRRIKELDEPIFVVYSGTGKFPGHISLTKFIGVSPEEYITPLVMMDGIFQFADECSNYYGCYSKEMLIEPEIFLDIAEEIKQKVDND